MRNGWRKAAVGELGQVITGTTPPTSKPEFYGGEIPFVAPGDLGKTLFVTKAERSLTEHGLARAKPVPKGAILFTCIGATIGKASIAGCDLATNQQINAVVCNESKICSEFLYYMLDLHVEDIRRLAGSQAIPIVNKSTFEAVIVPVPLLPEQLKIAGILRTWDEAIEKTTASLKARRRRFVWLRTHLFSGRVRLPGFVGEWSEGPLSEVLKEHELTSAGTEEVFSVSVHKGLINQIEHLGRSFAAQQTGHYNRVLPGDIVYTKSPTGDFPLGIIKQSKLDKEVIVSPLYGVFTPATRELGVILDAYFESPVTVRNYLRPLVQKGAKNTIAITNKRFLEGKLTLPLDPREQEAIAEFVETAQAEVACIAAEIKALTRQKRGLMQKLLTGEWRIKIEDCKEAAA
jgi:type I restriction enzyme S subunit